ncbi:MAG: hypothetical protein AB1Z23_04080 [Eubacteriales bacterium]
MRLTPPKKNVFWVTVIVGVLGLAAFVVGLIMELSILTICGFAAVAVAYLLLALSVALKGF